MPSILQCLLIGALSVAMVTAAPLSNQEKLVNVEQTGEAVDRAKRADEEIVFGNQQNKARVMAKKSDLSNVLSPAAPQGELDQGSEVIVHDAVPMSEDMAARAEAAQGETDEKMAEAVQAAMETVSNAAAAGQETASEAVDDEKVTKQLVEEEIEDGEQGAGEISELAEEEEDEEEEEEEDADLQDLQKATEVSMAAAAGSEGSQDENAPPQEDEVDEFLQELSENGEATEGMTEEERDKAMAEYYRKMYQYLMLPYNTGRGMLQGIPYYYYRRRRSAAQSSENANALSQGSNHRARRIKRDLLDDTYYDPYEYYTAPYAPVDVNDALVADPEEYVPLTDEEAEYLYKRLLNYLASNYIEEQANAYQEPARIDPYYLEGYEEPDEESYAPYSIYNEDDIPLVSSPYDEGYPYGPVDLDTYQSYAKRGMIDYYPQEEDKRYFFPFSDEPETHWGAFVPEKRDYDEAIQRLQRLAMALSDNPGPYYREMLEEYRRK